MRDLGRALVPLGFAVGSEPGSGGAGLGGHQRHLGLGDVLARSDSRNQTTSLGQATCNQL